MTIEQLKKEIEKLEASVRDPKTPQGDVRNLKFRLHDRKHDLEIAQRKEYEETTETSVYGSDDYVGATAGDYSFYFGYEVTRCPVKSHKNEDDCYEKDCDKREWVFQVHKGDDVVFEMLESEIDYPKADDIERKLIVGMAHYIKSISQ